MWRNWCLKSLQYHTTSLNRRIDVFPGMSIQVIQVSSVGKATSRERVRVSNHRRIHFLFSSFPTDNNKKIQSSTLQPFFEKFPPLKDGKPSPKASNVESVSMSLDPHNIRKIWYLFCCKHLLMKGFIADTTGYEDFHHVMELRGRNCCPWTSDPNLDVVTSCQEIYFLHYWLYLRKINAQQLIPLTYGARLNRLIRNYSNE